MYKPMDWAPHVQEKTLTEFQRNAIQAEDMAVAVNFHMLFSLEKKLKFVLGPSFNLITQGSYNDSCLSANESNSKGMPIS